MTEFSKRAVLIILVCGLLATSFNSFLFILEDNTVVTLVEELPDNDNNSTEKDVEKEETKTFEVFDFQVQPRVTSITISEFQNTSGYPSVYLKSITPPPELV